MRRSTTTTYILAVAVGTGCFYVYSKKHRGDPVEKLPSLSTATTIEPAPAAAPVPVPAPAPVPVQSPRLAPRPDALPSGEREVGPSTANLDDAHSAIVLFQFVRQAGDSPARADAVERLRVLSEAAVARASQAREAGDAPGERAALTAAYLSETNAKARAAHRSALDALAADQFFSVRPTNDAEFYTIQKGDTLTKIAARANFPVEGIQKINKLRASSLRIGERLKIPRGPVEILVVKGEFRLALLCGGKLVREYQVGTGREGCTPEAVFTIEEKIPEPTWHSKEGVFPFGHPKNILGTRWLGFKDTDEFHGFGIHGTAMPESIGTEASSGCIRMRNAEVEELFSFVPRGATVTITR